MHFGGREDARHRLDGVARPATANSGIPTFRDLVEGEPNVAHPEIITADVPAPQPEVGCPARSLGQEPSAPPEQHRESPQDDADTTA